MYKHILIATDGSPLSQKAEKSALRLAHSLGARLCAVVVVQRYQYVYMEGAALIPVEDAAKIEKGWVQNAEKMLLPLKKSAQKLDVTLQALVVKSDSVADTLIATAKKRKCDLIVMASNGRRGIARVLLGSQTQQVLTHSNIPVLILR